MHIDRYSLLNNDKGITALQWRKGTESLRNSSGKKVDLDTFGRQNY